MKGEVSISNWYLGDPKQSQVRVDFYVSTYAYTSSILDLYRVTRADLNALFRRRGGMRQAGGMFF